MLNHSDTSSRHTIMGSSKIKDVDLSVDRTAELEKEVAELKQALQNSEARFRLVATSISDAIYVAHISEEGQFVYNFISPNLRPITGYNIERFAKNPEFWFTYTHPDDRHIISKQLEQFQQAKGAEMSALSRLLVSVERYPDLKTTEAFSQLQS